MGRAFSSTQMEASTKESGTTISRMDMGYSPTQMERCIKESI